MISSQAGTAAVPRSGVEGDDAGITGRVESIVRRLIRPARGAAWAFGVFNADGDLVEFVLSGGGVNRRKALGALCAIPAPGSPEAVTLRVTGEDGQLADCLGAAVAIDTARTLALVVLRPPIARDQGWSKVAEGLQSAIRLVAKATLSELAVEERRASLPPRAAGALFLLTPQYEVAVESHPETDASELVDLVAPEGNHLPPLIERTVRRLTQGWDFTKIETCRAATAYPLPGLALRVAPMRGVDLLIGVFLETETSAHPIDRTASLFRISAREREVLHALLDGHSIADIASQLKLAESTVNDYVAKLIAKTSSRNRIEMAATLLGWPVFRSGMRSAQRRREEPENASKPPSNDDFASQPRVSWQYKIPARSES
ncbi:MAG: helix-turn-helix transcriptional regulator [Candidatus Baltobacteraceae bacterium]